MPHILLTVRGTVPTMWALGRQQDVVKHMRTLPHGAAACALATVRASQASVTTKRAFEFLVLTASRSGAVRLATWLRRRKPQPSGPAARVRGCYSGRLDCARRSDARRKDPVLRPPAAAQSRNDDRKPRGTASIFRSVNTLDRPLSVNTLPRAVGNTREWPSPGVRAASGISTARPPGRLGLSHVQPIKHYRSPTI